MGGKDNKWSDIWVLKLSKAGEIEWHYGGSDNFFNLEKPTQLIESNDGGYIVIGNTLGNNSNVDIMILKLNSNGKMDWQKSTIDRTSALNALSMKKIDGGHVFLISDWIIKLNINELFPIGENTNEKALDTNLVVNDFDEIIKTDSSIIMNDINLEVSNTNSL